MGGRIKVRFCSRILGESLLEPPGVWDLVVVPGPVPPPSEYTHQGALAPGSWSSGQGWRNAAPQLPVSGAWPPLVRGGPESAQREADSHLHSGSAGETKAGLNYGTRPGWGRSVRSSGPTPGRSRAAGCRRESASRVAENSRWWDPPGCGPEVPNGRPRIWLLPNPAPRPRTSPPFWRCGVTRPDQPAGQAPVGIEDPATSPQDPVQGAENIV